MVNVVLIIMPHRNGSDGVRVTPSLPDASIVYNPELELRD